jgi:hypothetical protein
MTGWTWNSKKALTRMVKADHQASAQERAPGAFKPDRLAGEIASMGVVFDTSAERKCLPDGLDEWFARAESTALAEKLEDSGWRGS